MKMKLYAIAALTVFFATCSKTDNLQTGDGVQKTEANALKQSEKSQLPPGPINFNAPNVFPEGVVYNPFNDRFLVSSISMGTIGSVSKQGIYSPFIQDIDLSSTAGLEIDKARKRLLVTNTNIGGTLAKLAIYDLNNQSRLFHINLLAVANDGAPHLANDVVIDQQGNAYVTDSYAGIIYKVDLNGNAAVFYRNAAFTPPMGQFGFNGIEYSNSNQGYLLVSHIAQNKIVKIPVNNPAALTTVQMNPSIVGPDGLLLSKNSKQLIVVNNTTGFPGSKVMSFQTSDNWATATSTEEFSTGIVYPTTVTSDGKNEYVLYSYIHLLFGGINQPTFTIQPLPFTGKNPF